MVSWLAATSVQSSLVYDALLFKNKTSIIIYVRLLWPRANWWKLLITMAFSLPCKLGNILGSSSSFGRHFLAITAETILKQMLKTATKLERSATRNVVRQSTEKKMYLAMMAMMYKSMLYLYMMFYLSSISSAQMSLIECNWRPSALVVFTGSKLMTSPAKLVMHHAGVAVRLVCLKLEMKGLCMLKEIITICVSTEYTRDFVLGRTGNICPVIIVYHAGVADMLSCLKLKKSGLYCLLRDFSIITRAECNWIPWVVFTGSILETSATKVMHHAGVAAKVISYLEKFLLMTLSNLMMSVAECKLINFKSFEGLSAEMRCSLRELVHHTGVAVMKDIKMNQERDSVMQKNKGVDEEVQNPNFSLVVGMLQLFLSLT